MEFEVHPRLQQRSHPRYTYRPLYGPRPVPSLSDGTGVWVVRYDLPASKLASTARRVIRGSTMSGP